MSLLFPDQPRSFPFRRTVRTLLRTLHILTTGTLIGGHIFAQAGRGIGALVMGLCNEWISASCHRYSREHECVFSGARFCGFDKSGFVDAHTCVLGSSSCLINNSLGCRFGKQPHAWAIPTPQFTTGSDQGKRKIRVMNGLKWEHVPTLGFN